LGTVWTGASVILEPDIKAALGAPEGARYMTMIALGYPAEEPLPPVRRPLSDVVSFEKWEKK
jgi:nitroreductase